MSLTWPLIRARESSSESSRFRLGVSSPPSSHWRLGLAVLLVLFSGQTVRAQFSFTPGMNDRLESFSGLDVNGVIYSGTVSYSGSLGPDNNIQGLGDLPAGDSSAAATALVAALNTAQPTVAAGNFLFWEITDNGTAANTERVQGVAGAMGPTWSVSGAAPNTSAIPLGGDLGLVVWSLPASGGGGAVVVMDLTAAELTGGAAQTGVQTMGLQFQNLGGQLRGIMQNIAAAGGGVAVVALPAPTAGNSNVSLASYMPGAPNPFAGDAETPGYEIRGQNSGLLNGEWSGWIGGYGIGGQVQGKNGIAGLDYDSTGTQLGLYRMLDACTVVGLFGSYGKQDVDTGDNTSADVESGNLGAFLHRSDHEGDYYTLAATLGYDSYDTSRNLGVNTGSFNGSQTGLFLERGWTRSLGALTVLPSAALQYAWIHQAAFTETGAGGASLSSSDTHSVRSIIGATIETQKLAALRGCMTLSSKAQWMHEFADDTTTSNGSVGGANFTTNGLSLGRDWAVMGLGMRYDRGGHLGLYGNYDVQFNERQTFHVGSGGVQWAW